MLNDLGPYESFVAAVEQPSITAAARHLGRSIQSVSRDLARIEADLGVRLIARTTRSRKMTAAGQVFYDRVKVLLSDLTLARDEARLAASAVAGALRISSSTLFGPRVVTPIIADFLARYPDVTIGLDLSDEFEEPTISGADVTIRIGELSVSSSIARKLGEVRRVVVAAPTYLAAHGRPFEPSDLSQHSCVIRRGAHDSNRWAFRENGLDEFVTVRGPFDTDNIAAANEAVVRGIGIGIAAYWQVRDLIDQGRLELLLTKHEPRPYPVHALWASSPHMPVRTRLFIEFLASRLAGQRL